MPVYPVVDKVILVPASDRTVPELIAFCKDHTVWSMALWEDDMSARGWTQLPSVGDPPFIPERR